MNKYIEIFTNLEATMKNQCRSFGSFDEFKEYESRKPSDDEYFDMLTAIVFYSGFKAETVSKKMDLIRSYFPNFDAVALYDDRKILEIMNDNKMIRNERKIKACIDNAKTFKNIVQKYGSFEGYVDSFKPRESFENLMLFKEAIEYTLEYLGGITSYHFMTDIGLPVLKPDRVITRIFKRLGVIESEKQLLKTVIQGRKFSEATGHPIRYIDIIFVKYGQMGEYEKAGLDDGICLEENPKCAICGVSKYCNYFAAGSSLKI